MIPVIYFREDLIPVFNARKRLRWKIESLARFHNAAQWTTEDIVTARSSETDSNGMLWLRKESRTTYPASNLRELLSE